MLGFPSIRSADFDVDGNAPGVQEAGSSHKSFGGGFLNQEKARINAVNSVCAC
jgi:hypothetical protein